MNRLFRTRSAPFFATALCLALGLGTPACGDDDEVASGTTSRAGSSAQSSADTLAASAETTPEQPPSIPSDLSSGERETTEPSSTRTSSTAGVDPDPVSGVSTATPAPSTPGTTTVPQRTLTYPPTLAPLFPEFVSGPHAYLGGIQMGPPLPEGGRAIVFGSGVELPQGDLSLDNPAGSIFSVDGRTNELIWESGTLGELFTVPRFVEGEESWSLLMAGRAGTFVHVSYEDGRPLWRADPDDYAETTVAYNFYTPALGHGLSGSDDMEMVTVYGGDPTRPAFAPRDASHVALVRASDGEVLAISETPDGAESYMSPILYRPTEEAELHILIGTGGETHAGSLWMAPLQSLLDDTLTQESVSLASSAVKGFMAPPSLHDLNDDGYIDIIAVAHDGQTFAISGKDQSILWTSTVPDAESYSVAALVRAPGDLVHVATQHLYGIFPNYTGALHRLLDGRTGEELWRLETNANALPSPVAADLKGEGHDAVVFLDTRILPGADDFSRVHILDVTTLEVTSFEFEAQFLSTPLISDSNDDGFLDLTIVASTGFASGPPSRTSMSWELLRLDLNASAENSISWGSYMGTENDGRMTQP